MYGIPRSTLQNRVSGRVVFGRPEAYLTEEEERELICFIKGCSEIGFSRTRQQVIMIVQQVMIRKGREDIHVSSGWWAAFRKRHPQLSLRTAEQVSYVRSLGTRPEILSKYFNLLKDTLLQNDLFERPCQIFNMDETGMPLSPVPQKVICLKGSKHTTTGDKSQITVVACCSAGGFCMPPMVIFDRKTLKPELTIGEVPGTIYGLSGNGWIDSELFNFWFLKHFLLYAPPTRPILLLMDGHSTHFNPVTIEYAAEHQIIMFCLPPHSSHCTQPLDKGCFGPLKQYWRQECHSFLTQNPGRIVTRYEFSFLFSKAWYRGMTMSNILGGFSNTEIYPINREVVVPQSLFVPLYLNKQVLTTSRCTVQRHAK